MKKAGSIIHMAAGGLAIILALVSRSYFSGVTQSSNVYGGDAYTGIQQASAATANNVFHLIAIIQFGVFAILLVIGIALIGKGIVLFSETISSTNKAVVTNDTQTAARIPSAGSAAVQGRPAEEHIEDVSSQLPQL